MAFAAPTNQQTRGEGADLEVRQGCQYDPTKILGGCP